MKDFATFRPLLVFATLAGFVVGVLGHHYFADTLFGHPPIVAAEPAVAISCADPGEQPDADPTFVVVKFRTPVRSEYTFMSVTKDGRRFPSSVSSASQKNLYAVAVKVDRTSGERELVYEHEFNQLWPCGRED